MICYRDRTYCETPMCGDPECSRIVTDEVRSDAARLGLHIAYAMPCMNPKTQPKETGHD